MCMSVRWLQSTLFDLGMQWLHDTYTHAKKKHCYYIVQGTSRRKDIVMTSQLFRIQDLDFLSFYDVSTQLFLVHNVAHGRPANTKYRAFFYSAHKLSWDCVYSLFAGKPVAV